MTGCRVIMAALLMIASTVAAAADAPAEPDKIKIGEFIPEASPQPAPEISFTTPDGKPLALADFKGRFLVLNLWATWCHPCLKEMPSLARLQEKLGPALIVLAVSEDRGGAAVVTPFVAALDLGKMTIGLDPKSEALHAFHARGLPTSLIIDGEGRVLGKVECEADWTSDAMLAVLKKLMPAGSGTSSPGG
jgi:thiol-disulfide isomerase/thioredoxin